MFMSLKVAKLYARVPVRNFRLVRKLLAYQPVTFEPFGGYNDIQWH
jgi:hypothetical protein